MFSTLGHYTLSMWNKVSSDKKSKPAGNWNSISYIREKDTHNSGMRKVVVRGWFLIMDSVRNMEPSLPDGESPSVDSCSP